MVYHVLLEGRTVGPYDRRTIVGMRIKKTLTGDNVLISTDGARLTVADLVGKPPPQPLFNADRSGGFSIVQATFSASLLEVDGPGIAIPKFKDEIQARVQGEVLRLAGRFRHGLGWKEDRVKILLKDVVHARVRGSQVDLWLRNAPQTRLQRVALELFTSETAAEFVGWLPRATPLPDPATRPEPLMGTPASLAAPTFKAMWVALAGITVVVILLLAVLLLRRIF